MHVEVGGGPQPAGKARELLGAAVCPGPAGVSRKADVPAWDHAQALFLTSLPAAAPPLPLEPSCPSIQAGP